MNEILCKLCRKVQTSCLGTECCDGCWELETRVEAQPDLAVQVLRAINKLPRDPFGDVAAFHEKFGLLGLGCGPLPKDGARRRADQMREELREFEDACTDDDPVKAVDALVDLVYFALGSAVSMGVQKAAWGRCWAAVHAANMAKVRTGNIRSLKQGIEKPEGWASPNAKIAAALKFQGFEVGEET